MKSDPTQASAARLAAIAEKCERNNDSLLACGNDYSDVLLDAANALRDAAAQIDTLRQEHKQACADAASEAVYGGQQRERAVTAEAALQQAREVLNRFGRHMASCEGHPNRRVYPTGEPCTCGLDAALKAVR